MYFNLVRALMPEPAVRTMHFGAFSGFLFLSFSLSAWAAEPVYHCAFNELMMCGEGLGCSDEGSENIDLPRKVKVDIGKGELSGLDDAGNLREAKAQNVEKQDEVYFFQAIQRTRAESSNIVGWTIFLDSKSMKISGSAVHGEIVFNVFGDCDDKTD